MKDKPLWNGDMLIYITKSQRIVENGLLGTFIDPDYVIQVIHNALKGENN